MGDCDSPMLAYSCLSYNDYGIAMCFILQHKRDELVAALEHVKEGIDSKMNRVGLQLLRDTVAHSFDEEEEEDRESEEEDEQVRGLSCWRFAIREMRALKT